MISAEDTGAFDGSILQSRDGLIPYWSCSDAGTPIPCSGRRRNVPPSIASTCS